MRKPRRQTIAVLLLTLFLCYYGNGILFSHTHTVGSTHITHAHPYAAGSTNHPGHTHTGAELQIIHLLTHTPILFTAATVLAEALFLLLQTLYYRTSRSQYAADPVFSVPRAPPV